MKTIFLACLAGTMASAPAIAQEFEIIDQIGDDNDAFYTGTKIYPSTDYADANTPFDYFAIDNFTLSEPTRITRFEAIYAEQAPFGIPVQRWRISIFTSTSVALQTLVGDAYVELFDEPTTVIENVDTFGSTDIDFVSFELAGVTLAPGEYWIGLQAVCNEGTWGQMFAFGTTLGDDVAYRLNYYPPGSSGGPSSLTPVTVVTGVPGDLAYRVVGEEPTSCPADFNGDGARTVQDLLAYLSAFRARSESADFNESGEINVQDLLAYLSAFRAGC